MNVPKNKMIIIIKKNHFKGIPLFIAIFHLWSHVLQIFSSQAVSKLLYKSHRGFWPEERKGIDLDTAQP